MIAQADFSELKPDWEQARERLIAWWEREVVDRVCLQVQAPRAGARLVPLAPPSDLWQQWTDVEGILGLAECRLCAAYFGGEAFPIFEAKLGPDNFSAFLGSEVTLAPDTAWTHPLISNWQTAPPLKLQRDNYWWQLMLAFLRASMERSRGRWLTCLPDTHNGPDALSCLRGREAACTDLYDHPQEVAAAMRDICAASQEIYAEYFAILQPEIYSSSGWLPAWWPGRANVIQSDFMALISPAMFQHFFHEWLLEEVGTFERVIYHLDGPPSLPHLDYLLNLPQIAAIQWVPGDGALPISRWLALLRRIQAAGKGLHLSVAPWEVEPLLSELSSRGLMLQMWVDSEEEAQTLLALAACLTRG